MGWRKSGMVCGIVAWIMGINMGARGRTQEAVPAPEEAVPAPEVALAPEEAVPAPEVAPAPEEAVPAPEEAVLAPEEAVPAPEVAIQEPDIRSWDALSSRQQKILDDIESDLPPEVLNAVRPENEGQHFYRSDEKHPEMFYDTIANLGGTYIGVGTDQGYVYAGWQKPTLAFLIDYDPVIVVVHRIYMFLISQCEDASCVLKNVGDREAMRALFRSDAGRAAGLDDDQTWETYRDARHRMVLALGMLKRMDKPTMMNDPETYRFIKTLIASGRMRTYQANLLGDTAFKSMADALRALDARVTTLYLSNAEQYWGYTEKFKQNMTGLPYDEKGLIMRTSASYPSNNDYRYSVQPAEVFCAWLRHPEGRNVRSITRRARIESPEHIPFSVDSRMPPAETDNSRK